jgi:hypothetical protein
MHIPCALLDGDRSVFVPEIAISGGNASDSLLASRRNRPFSPARGLLMKANVFRAGPGIASQVMWAGKRRALNLCMPGMGSEIFLGHAPKTGSGIFFRINFRLM